MYKEYEVKIKMVQEQWKMLFSGGKLTLGSLLEEFFQVGGIRKLLAGGGDFQ